MEKTECVIKNNFDVIGTLHIKILKFINFGKPTENLSRPETTATEILFVNNTKSPYNETSFTEDPSVKDKQ